jgi:hypothetical protein
MRRRLFLIPLVLLLACKAVTSITSSPAPAAPTLTIAPFPSLTLTQTVTQTALPEPATPTLSLPPLPQAPFQVRYHPDGGLYAGDQVSFEVIAPQGAEMDGRKVEVQVDGNHPATFGPVDFGSYGIAGRVQATLVWAWDTSGLAPGSYDLTFTIQPDELHWTETVGLLPASDLPVAQAKAHWAEARSECCRVYYITGTAAARDLDQLLVLVDQQAGKVEQKFNAHFSNPPSIEFLSRVLGHGGFANEEIAVSYLDLRYSGADPAIVLRHELVHVMDMQLQQQAGTQAGRDRVRPTILVEGLAVYVSGGHFKEEPLMPRAAALLKLGWYQPLGPLGDNFYPSQHETGYLEAGALIEYMVDRWGWEAFNQFYRDIRFTAPDRSQVDAMDAALKQHFNLSFEQLEADFKQALGNQEVTPEQELDLRLTVNFYDTVRRYQQALDPSAYYLTAWLPDGKQMRTRGIVADFLRHPGAPENVALEELLVAADSSLRGGDYATTDQLLKAVNAALDALGK